MITFHIGWPQGIYLVLLALGFLATALRHGKMETVDVWSRVIGICVALTLLYWGGFFR